MSALLELIKEAPPEDRKAVAEYLKPYLVTEKKKPVVDHWVNIEELRPYTPGKKAKAWLTQKQGNGRPIHIPVKDEQSKLICQLLENGLKNIWM